jgi:hypothetical protein
MRTSIHITPKDNKNNLAKNIWSYQQHTLIHTMLNNKFVTKQHIILDDAKNIQNRIS